MEATTYRSFVDGLEALSVSGVTRSYTQGPPGSLNTADLPAQWVELPRGEEPLVAKSANWPTLRADLVVATEAVGQNTQASNFDGAVDMLDAMGTALRSFDVGKTDASWELRQAIKEVAGTAYWAVVASVEVKG